MEFELAFELDPPQHPVSPKPAGKRATYPERQQDYAKRLASPVPVPALTPQELLSVILNARGFDSTNPRKRESDPSKQGVTRPPWQSGRGLGVGAKTFAAAQVLDRAGRQVAFEQAVYSGGGQRHAEAQIISRLLRRLGHSDTRGFNLMIAVDQKPCTPSDQNCEGLLKAFARRMGLALQVFVPHLHGSGPKWSARRHNQNRDDGRVVTPVMIISA
jgi:hypothetical protein